MGKETYPPNQPKNEPGMSRRAFLKIAVPGAGIVLMGGGLVNAGFGMIGRESVPNEASRRLPSLPEG